MGGCWMDVEFQFLQDEKALEICCRTMNILNTAKTCIQKQLRKVNFMCYVFFTTIKEKRQIVVPNVAACTETEGETFSVRENRCSGACEFLHLL